MIINTNNIDYFQGTITYSWVNDNTNKHWISLLQFSGDGDISRFCCNEGTNHGQMTIQILD